MTILSAEELAAIRKRHLGTYYQAMTHDSQPLTLSDVPRLLASHAELEALAAGLASALEAHGHPEMSPIPCQSCTPLLARAAGLLDGGQA